MLKKATQSNRQLALFTELEDDTLLMEKFVGREALSELSRFELSLLSGRSDIQPGELLGTNVTWIMSRDEGEPRYFNGYVIEFGQTGQTERGIAYEATVVPWTWFLGQTTNCRIFQDQNSVDIIERVIDDLGFGEGLDTSLLTQTYEKRRYCVQYRESTLDFVSRLMEEEGIYYYFRHENGKHSMVLCDSQLGYSVIGESETHVATWAQPADATTHLVKWERENNLRPGAYASRDFNFRRPTLDLSAESKSGVDYLSDIGLEVYEYPGLYQRRKHGSQLTRVRMEEHEVDHHIVRATGSCWTFVPGGLFSIKDHPDPSERNREFVIRAVEYQTGNVGGYTSGETPIDDQFVWQTSFEAMSSDVVFRPSRKTPKAIISGPQTATVVGPRGNQIHTDKHGRVKCHFHWDRESSRNEHSSCWIRVSQVHAGAGWGSMDIPRIGEEVIVSFLDGDPDRPIIKGRVYNGDTTPPFDLPGSKTRSGGKSNTHKGSGYNELSMDDTAGSEQARMNAQYDMDSEVRNNQTLSVGTDRSAQIVNNDSLVVGSNKSTEVGADASITVGNNLNYDVGSDVVIESGVSITLACGASTIKMNMGGVITVSGQFVSSLAAATHSIVAPMTEIAGAQMLNQAGLFCFDLGGVCHVKGKKTSFAGPSVDVTGGITVVKGAKIEIGSVGAPIVTLPGGAGGGGGGPGGPKPPGGLSHQDAKGLSQAAYGADRDYKAGDTIRYNGKDWKVEQVWDESSGFQATHLKGPNGENVLAVAGTDFFTLPDYDDNISQGLGGIPPQYQRVDEITGQLLNDPTNQNLVVTGHSLGGGLANYAAGVHGIPGVGLNAAPLGAGTLEQIAQRGPAGSTDNFVHYQNQSDPVSQGLPQILPGQHPGTVVQSNNNVRLPISAHVTANINPNDPIQVVGGPLEDQVYQEYWRQRLNNPSGQQPDPPEVIRANNNQSP